MAFAWEREFRLAVSVRMAEEFGVQVPEQGVTVEFDFLQLIENIYLGPALPETDAEAIRAAERRMFSKTESELPVCLELPSRHSAG